MAGGNNGRVPCNGGCGVKTHVAGSLEHQRCLQRQGARRGGRRSPGGSAAKAMGDYAAGPAGGDAYGPGGPIRSPDTSQASGRAVTAAYIRGMSIAVALSFSPRLRRAVRIMEQAEGVAAMIAEGQRQGYLKAKQEYREAMDELDDALDRLEKLPPGSEEAKQLRKKSFRRAMAAQRGLATSQERARTAERKLYNLSRRYNLFMGRATRDAYPSFDDHVKVHGYTCEYEPPDGP